MHLRVIEKDVQLMVESENNVKQLYNESSDLTEAELENKIDDSDAYTDK